MSLLIPTGGYVPTDNKRLKETNERENKIGALILLSDLNLECSIKKGGKASRYNTIQM
jgi:hypothetical protein